MGLKPLNANKPATGANFRIVFTLPKGKLVHIAVGNDTNPDRINVDLKPPGAPAGAVKPFHELINNENAGAAEYVLWDGAIKDVKNWILQATFQLASAADRCNLNVLIET